MSESTPPSSASTDDQRPERSPRPDFLSVSLVLLIFAAGLTLDEVRFPSSIPLKSTDVATVPLFNVWTIGWNADRAAHCLDGYWQAPIFFPALSAFAFSEPQPATLLVAPVVQATGSAVTGYKVWLFFSLFLNGLFASLLLRRLGHGWFLQLAGGIALLLLPVVHQRIDVLQLVPVWGILWFWSSLFVLVREPQGRAVIETGVSFATCFALCVHHGLFLCLLMPVAALVFVSLLADRRFLVAALGAAATGGALILPVVLPIHEAIVANGFVRQDQMVRNQSAQLHQYLNTPSNALIQFNGLKGAEGRQFNVGWFRMALAALGVSGGLWYGRRRRWLLFLLLTAGSSLIFSLGLNLEVFGWRPWQTLSQSLPGVSQVRNVYRFVWFFQMAIVLLGVEGLAVLHAISDRCFGLSCQDAALRKTAFAGLVVLPGVLLAGEIWPEPARRAGVPDVAGQVGWVEFIRANRTDGRPIACLPFAAGNSVRDFDMTVRWMCYGLEHGAPLLNGYSGFFPRSYFELRNFVNREFPSAAVIDRFTELNVEYLVVARQYCEPDVLLDSSNGGERLELVYEDQTRIDVYRLRAVPGGSTQAIR